MTRPIRWVPREHGAWAILAIPLVLGIAAAGATPAHALLAVAAIAAYLFSVPFLDWMRTRRPERLPPILVFGAIAAGSGIPLLVQRPELALVGGFVIAAGLVTVALTIGGRPNSVLVSLVQVAQAIALVPAAAMLTGTLEAPETWRAMLAAGLYLGGTVLLVRSMIRARGDRRFLAASIAFHAAGLVAAVVLLPWPYALLAAALLGRSIALPLLASSSRRLRPIHIGLVEIAASTTIVVLALSVGFSSS